MNKKLTAAQHLKLVQQELRDAQDVGQHLQTLLTDTQNKLKDSQKHVSSLQNCIADLSINRVKVLDALQGLMEAHRDVFKYSLFAGFRAGKTTFVNAWKAAEAVINDRG